ncbi:hypothetical protein KKC45_01430 [Patescibacteria group bacterium]|nr:hypothetical protein [Patescibacteria group bacterium]
MKNKNNILIIIGALLIVGYIFFYGSKPNDIQVNINQDNFDYSQLEKDNLYTEEEGKYENLSDEGKELLRTVLTLPECIDDPTLNYCYDHQQAITRSSIVSLKDKFLLSILPTVKSPRYAVYDLRSSKPVNNGETNSNNTIRNAEVIIFIQEKDMLYYKPGMNSLKKVEGSTLQGSHTYAELYGFINIIDVSFIDDNSIRASVFDANQLLPEEPYKARLHKKIEEKILIIE